LTELGDSTVDVELPKRVINFAHLQLIQSHQIPPLMKI
jgi:hypothetical protein